MKIEIGTRVSCGLGWAGAGIVYGIHGEQKPESIRSLCGVIAAGGNAELDVVYLNGALSKKIPESIVRGVQWDIFDEVASAEEIAAALAYSACERAAQASAKQVAAEKFAAEVERLKGDATHAKLVQGDDKYSGKLASKNLRTELKAAFPGVKFSVRKRHHGSVDIGWTDGPIASRVEEISGKYSTGHFDGMQDLKTTHHAPWNLVFGGADYVFTQRDHSAAHVQKAIDALFSTHGGLDGIEKPTPETVGRNYTPVPGEQWELATLIRIKSGELEG